MKKKFNFPKNEKNNTNRNTKLKVYCEMCNNEIWYDVCTMNFNKNLQSSGELLLLNFFWNNNKTQWKKIFIYLKRLQSSALFSNL